jgi:uncharacterized coiled-coil protein SlyX
MSKEIVLKEHITVEVDDLDQRIAERVDVIRSIQERIAALQDKVQSVKDELRSLLNEKGSSWSDDEGYARIIADAVRRTYDSKALDELIITDPLRHGWLKDYRKETPVRGGVQVK